MSKGKKLKMGMKSLLFGRLYRELILATVAIMAGSLLTFYLIDNLSISVVQYMIDTTHYDKVKEEAAIRSLKEYIREQELTMWEGERLKDWEGYSEPITIGILKDGEVIYDSYWGIDGKVGKKELAAYAIWYPTYDVAFADGQAQMYFDGFFDYKTYRNAKYVNGAASTILFMVLFLRLIKNKIRYVTRLEHDIHILESGNLTYEVEVKGYDELAQLAQSLNNMRISLSGQIRAKEEAFHANRELITALSHDLRTPLTTQTGYLEILKERHYVTQEEHDRYVEKCLDTCRQIKDMSDRLFEYFMAYRREDEEEECPMEAFEATELLLQFLSEHTLLLEEEGFVFEQEICRDEGRIMANVDYLCRIFDNIFSNLQKYADRSKPVRVRLACPEGQAVLEIWNAIEKKPVKVESTKIGVENVKSMMRQQKGTVEVVSDGVCYGMILKFPLRKH